MNKLEAYFFDGRTPERHAVSIQFSESGYLVVQGFGIVMRYPLHELEVRPQLGGQPAVIELPDQARLEVTDPDAFFAVWQSMTGRKQWQHTLEAHWKAILVVALLTLGFGWFLYEQGVPAIAKWTASIMPPEIEQKLERDTLQVMESSGYGASTLSRDRQERIRAAMQEVIDVVGGGDEYYLMFLGGKNVPPNAYALPYRTIVFTDAFVRMAESTDELRAIMAHELGHARNHHVLRTVLQKSLLAGLVTVITGDVATAGSMAIAVPKFLLEASYSREFEYEADEVAKEYLLATGKPLSLFADIMGRFEERNSDRVRVPGILSTHPATEERIRAFMD